MAYKQTYTVSYEFMGHGISDIGHSSETRINHAKNKDTSAEDFVLDKDIFNTIFEKDIRRVFIYKKSERLAKAIHLVAPAFADSVSFKNRLEAIAIGLVDAAVRSPAVARTNLSHELLALSSILSMARTGGILSPMNAEIISQETRSLLHEVAAYEEPRLLLGDALTLSGIAKTASKKKGLQAVSGVDTAMSRRAQTEEIDKGHVKDMAGSKQTQVKDRREAVMSVIKNKGSASIKDISTLIRDVSEKTIQRELTSLIQEGLVVKRGERRWSTYTLAQAVSLN